MNYDINDNNNNNDNNYYNINREIIYIIGQKGPQGERGIQGIQGEQGERGIQGIQGEQGIQGIPGSAGTGTGITFTEYDKGNIFGGTSYRNWNDFYEIVYFSFDVNFSSVYFSEGIVIIEIKVDGDVKKSINEYKKVGDTFNKTISSYISLGPNERLSVLYVGIVPFLLNLLVIENCFKNG